MNISISGKLLVLGLATVLTTGCESGSAKSGTGGAPLGGGTGGAGGMVNASGGSGAGAAGGAGGIAAVVTGTGGGATGGAAGAASASDIHQAIINGPLAAGVVAQDPSIQGAPAVTYSNGTCQ